jgi:hypothetical protein
MKKKENQTIGKKEFKVTLTFKAFRHLTKCYTEDLNFTAFELIGKTQDESILEALVNFKLDDYEISELKERIGLDEETIKRFAKESKSLNDFELLVYRKLLKENWENVVTTYGEDEHGCEDSYVDTTRTMEDVLAEEDFKYQYGCEFEIEEILPCSEKVFRYEAVMSFMIKSGSPSIPSSSDEEFFNFQATRNNFDATFLKIVGDVYEQIHLEKESISWRLKDDMDEKRSKMYKSIYELARKVKSRDKFLKKLIEESDNQWRNWWLSELDTNVKVFDIEREKLDKKEKDEREKLDKKEKDFLDSVKEKAKARKLEILKKVRETSDPIELEKLSNTYLDLI